MKIGNCIHYNGAFKKKRCLAGVKYGSLVKRGERGWVARLPCIQSSLTKCSIECVNKVEATKEDVEKWLDESRESIAMVTRIRTLIAAKVEDGMSSAGTVNCPYCGSDVNYTHAGLNGHIHAACTGGCVAWME